MGSPPRSLRSPNDDQPAVSELRQTTLSDGSTLSLRVDPVSLAALEAAKQAGSTTGHGALPDLEEVPLLLVVLEARVDGIEARLMRLEDA